MQCTHPDYLTKSAVQALSEMNLELIRGISFELFAKVEYASCDNMGHLAIQAREILDPLEALPLQDMSVKVHIVFLFAHSGWLTEVS